MAHRENWRSPDKTSNRGLNSFRKRNQAEIFCVHFERGRCHYGERCRFSHGVKKASDFEANPAAYYPATHDLDARNKYFDWKRLLRNGISGSGYSRREHEEIVRFWNGALEILESDSRENHQFLAKDLVDDNLHGYDFILATADADNPEGMRLIPTYDTQFLKVITHTSVLNCLSVDSFVGTLYTSFGGTNGDRAIRYLRSVCRSLLSKGEETNENALVISLDTMKLLLNTLYQLLSRVRRARFHDEIPALLDLTREVASKIAETGSKADFDGLESRIKVMQSLISSANRSLCTPRVHEESPKESGSALSSFPLDMQTHGGRHDNDLAEISQVQILPTHGEIVSGNSEYLPSTNFLQPHFLPDPLQRYIDSTFRLLRHDIFGSAKDVLRDLLQQNDLTQFSYFSSKDSGAHLYLGAQVPHIFINERKELEATVSFGTPPQVRKKTSNEQCRWWQDSNRLEEGSLVCFLASQETHRRLIFLEVTVKNASKGRAHQHKSSLVSDKFPPSITVKLATCLQQELILLARLYSKKLTGILVDFHGLIPATFAPILKILQRIQREGELAFQKWILPGTKDDEDGHSIPPPAYARKPGFLFPLTSITIVGAEKIALDPGTPESIDLLKLQTQTGLDRGQCQGLIAALTREYALIQGPPGTGKSYLGVKLVQVLLEIKEKAKLGPILVICYTNHALDQFLKHLLDVGIQKILRIGGRSEATELEGKNLRVVSKGIGKTRVESQTLGMSYGRLEDCMRNAGYAMKPLHQSQKGLSWAAMEHFLHRKWPIIHKQLERPDPEGFTTVTNDKLLNWLGAKSMKTQKGQNESEVDEVRLEDLTRAANENIHSLSIPERRILALSWFKQWQEIETASLFEALDRAANLRGDINAVHEEVNRRALIQADVVGITTTALARYIETLRRVGTKVIICEEAAEVMEAHVISALMPGVEHFIRIGDHRQLRPQIQNHSLSLETSTGKTWQLDRSQFERRAVGEPGLKPAPVAQLNVQRRMRPEISQLIKRVYPKLEDHGSVENLPNVVGMRNNLFWLDHRCDEDSRDDGSRVKSHSNQWEVDMATALVRHLVRQGEYRSTDIALLTPYTGQLRKLRASLSNDFEICLSERDLETLAADGLEKFEDEYLEPNGRKSLEKKTLLQTLRLATVDNFQGEEAKVIVVSLVRSNSKRKVGFLRTENRINVLLSRAQHGMYLIGNTETYVNVPMWADVHSQLARANAVGTELALCCPRHSDTPILCYEPHDFERKRPEDAPGPANTKAPAQCLARQYATGFLAMSDALKFLNAAINARASAEKIVQIICAKTAATRETPVESVDGLVGLDEVYTRDKDGKFDGLRDVSSSLANVIPSCPDCKQPIRQFVTKRYNRVINRAVMDETWKRFLIKGRTELESLESRLNDIEDKFNSKRATVDVGDTKSQLEARYAACARLAREALTLSRDMEAENRPMKRLMDAIATYRKSSGDEVASLSARMEAMNMTTRESDNQITLGARLIYIKSKEVMLSDAFRAIDTSRKSATLPRLSLAKLSSTLIQVLKDCRDLITQANEGNFSRIVITATVSFAKIAQLDAWYHRSHPGETTSDLHIKGKPGLEKLEDRFQTTRDLLAAALKLCDELRNCPELQQKVQQMACLYEGTRYEPVTLEELQSIKTAMVSGRGGIATHSGHWYNCVNGHPLAIGECGMPMEQARCPECGAPIGGQNHTAVEGVSRPQEME
ncbi:hypothetical protein ETB97_000534 [Aspergillus alliaceus]|uniref:NFX1-type zinc finger-containing protein 1 n=1 Tax=Petromyces alliaceus TaxID=209559 RepID=A0A8H6A5X7_PETAA|nr:hypothetical protein ETB97_000534 [Aspergillus burnettii]